MNRFNFDGSEEPEPNDEDQFSADILERQEALDWAYLSLRKNNVQQRLLNSTIKMLESSFFWKFKSNKTKLIEINEAFKVLKGIMETE